jgi:hypothetical protein
MYAPYQTETIRGTSFLPCPTVFAHNMKKNDSNIINHLIRGDKYLERLET